LTPAAFNLPPWHVVLIHDTREAFWSVVEAGFRDRLERDRLARYLDRLEGFRPGVAIALIYEDRAVHPQLRDAWQITDEQATAFVQQGLGMLQLSIWLSLAAEGLATSLQHWDWLLQDRLAAFVGLPTDRFHLAAALPIGYPDEPPREVERTSLDRVVSLERVAVDVTGH
jgi:predicted oxidoreductase (fatty acid repression mutant protein)